jgi:hypothetical protein
MLSYIAGIVDGEGTIDFDKKYSKAYLAADYYEELPSFSLNPRVRVCNTFYSLIERLQLVLGGRIVSNNRPRKSNHKKEYSLEITGDRAVAVVKALYPYLIIKRDQAYEILEYDSCNYLHRDRRAWKTKNTVPTNILSMRQGYYSRIHYLNSKRDNSKEANNGR